MVYDQLNIGGIETLIIRTSKWLLDHGYEVKLILREKGSLFKTLDSRVQVKVYKRWYELLFTPLLANIVFHGSFYQHLSIVYTFRPEGLWIASVLAKVKKTPIKVFNCVYHPHEFHIHGKDHYQTKYYSKLLLSSFPSRNLAFMNLPCKVSHEFFFKRNFTEAFIFPLPVTNGSSSEFKRIPTKYKLVSIGNFKPFKTYNLYMVDVVEKLVGEGFPVLYEIYGEGEMRSLIEKEINRKNLNKYIHLKGQVLYENFKDVLTDAFLFIGTGTAAVEAALCQVPTIVATCDSQKSYGYMYNMPDFAVGEPIEMLEEYEVPYLIKKVFYMTQDEYQIESVKNYNHALRYDMDTLMASLINKFETPNGIEDYSFNDLPFGLYSKYYFHRIFHKLSCFTSTMVNKLFSQHSLKRVNLS